ncbi:MAG: hypothetical protein EOM34_09335 [Clostridia bacterium]|nr:ATP-grasp domain-containing protein [Lachnospiraceae bacterium]NCC00867.1 hypothetical protein [Clostridia bacterium]NCD02097.1 hypothetical protein [Clostridia bacterium]
MALAIIFPSSYFDISKIDKDLKAEYVAVRETGLYDTFLFGYDQWFNDSKLVMPVMPEKLTTAVYRGWMMKPEKYKLFYHYLLNRKIRLITSPEEYEKFHIFPNIYEAVADDTAKMICFPCGKDKEHPRIKIKGVKETFNRFMVKDYVKSVKGTEFPKYFGKDITQKEFDKWMEIFYKYRGDLFTGGVCIKEYLDLKKYSGKTNEYRVFYVKNEPLSVSRNSNQVGYTKELPKELIDKYKDLPSVFYTIDYAELEDGSWKVIEAGDGSVSGLSPKQDEKKFYRALYFQFEVPQKQK